jgi:uncharacterized protein YkwD
VWTGVATLLVLAFLSTGFAFAAHDARAVGRIAATAVPAASHIELREALLDLTNDDRAEHDRDDLRLARRVSRYAVEHSRAMAERGGIYHSTDEELREALGGATWAAAGENVGVGDSIDGLQDAFMASRPHRRNVLSRTYDRAAIGVVVAYDRVWVTVVFYG